MAAKRSARLTLAAVALIWAAHAAAVLPIEAPDWSDLSASRQQTLAPLAKDWKDLPDERKRKWVGIADRYPGFTPAEQARLQQRMREWAALTPAQRTAARNQYRALQRIAPEKREALLGKWEAYLELPQDEKQRLIDAAPRQGAKPAAPVATPQKPAPIRPSILFRPVAPLPASPPATAASGEPGAKPSAHD
jgi:hypothetical protein